jgi:hypothetical protein
MVTTTTSSGRNTERPLLLIFCSEKFGEALCFQRGFQQGFAELFMLCGRRKAT